MRQQVSIDDIKGRLLDRIEDVVHRYAPPVQGSFRKGELFATLNPGRADRSVGSFFVHMHGPKVGRWNDYAMSGRDAHGDVLDLIRLSCGFASMTDAIKEARAFLGLDTESPELRRARDEAAARAKVRRAEEEAKAKAEAAKRAEWARGIWLSAQPSIIGTPVQHYLAARGLDPATLPRIPNALRYHPECTYREEVEDIDQDTGEVRIDPRSGRPAVRILKTKLPAMVSAIVNGAGKMIAVHRTYLAIDPATGRWGKAPVGQPKSVLADSKGGSIRLSTGTGPRGGKAIALAQCPPGTRVYIAEGIETALSVMLLRPEVRVLAAVSLSNMASIELPDNVAEVVLLSDGDQHPTALAGFDHAVKTHAAKGRLVRVWRSDVPGEDFNDALRRRMRERGAAA